MGARLVAVGKFSPREFRLMSDRTLVGSAPTNSLVLDHETVSRRHATLDRHDGAHWITDLGSTNGTFVNGARATRSIRLRDGDEISFGAVKYVLRADEPPVIDTRNDDARRRPVARQLIVALPIILIVAATGYFFIGNFNDLEMASVSDHPTVIATIALAPRSTVTPETAAIATIAPSPTKVIDSSGATDWLAVLNGYRASASGARDGRSSFQQR